ncbi:MAG: DJ-1/PfpI family protein [Tissierellia bacterium]|nr:DJ-1/PfpI family protein [Tissierellia bacterium]
MKKLLVYLAEGFEETEAVTVIDYVRRSGAKVETVSITEDRKVKGAHDITLETDTTIDKLNLDEVDAIYLPGGQPGANNLRDNDKVIQTIQQLYKDGKLVTAICAAPIVLDKAKVIEDKKITSFPTFKEKLTNYKEYEEDKLVVEDGNIITSRGPATAIYIAMAIVEKLQGKEKKEELKEEILQKLVEKSFL